MAVDIHAHLQRDVNNKYLVDELLMDMEKNNIEKRVVSVIRGNCINDMNKVASDLSEAYPDKIIGCAYINLKLDSALEDTKYALSLPGIKMFEFNSFSDGYYPDSEPNVKKVFELISQTNIPVKVFVGLGATSLPHQWESVSKKFPNVKMIYLHMGCFDYGYSCVDIVDRNENAYIETSNQYELQILKKAFKKLNNEKILFGTSYPERLTSNGKDIFDLFDISENDLELILRKNAIKLLNL